ncbi:MAG: DUF6223 family protein [Ginsengibacter sp.]
MKKYIPSILTAWLIVGFTFLVTEKVFSQTSQGEIKSAAADSTTTKSREGYTYVKGLTAGRARALVGVVLGIISLIVGWRSKIRSAKTGAKVALALGLITLIISVVHLSTSAGAVFGSGSGKAGAIVALVLALICITLGGLTLRSRKIDAGSRAL